MNNGQKKYYLYIDGQAVPVSEQVFRASRHHGRKEEYFTYDLKTEKFSCNQETQTARFTPSREDSYERLLGAGHQFATGGPTPEEEAISSLWLKELMCSLSRRSVESFIISMCWISQSGKPALPSSCPKPHSAAAEMPYSKNYGIC